MNRVLSLTLLTMSCVAMATVPAVAQQPTHKPGGFHSPEIQKDQSWSHVFNATGMSWYHCHPHPFMQASVEVKEGASTAPVTIQITGFKFVPEHVVVGVGTNVTWVNRDASFHTVDESLEGPTTDGGGGKSPGPGILMLALVLVVAAAWPRRR